MQQLGERLRTRARELGLSDSEVARKAGLAQNRYANYVTGVREPDFRTFIRICDVLKMTPNDALGVGPVGGGRATAARARLDALLDTFSKEKLELALLLLNALGGYEPLVNLGNDGEGNTA